MNSLQQSIHRVASLLGLSAVHPGGYYVIKLVPEPKGCCCFHCWPSAWAAINQHIAASSPIGDEGDVFIRADGGSFVLESHESGPAIIVYLAVVTASAALAKSIVDLIKAFLDALGKEPQKPVSRLRIVRRRANIDNPVDEELLEVEVPLNEEVARELSSKITRVISGETRGEG